MICNRSVSERDRDRDLTLSFSLLPWQSRLKYVRCLLIARISFEVVECVAPMSDVCLKSTLENWKCLQMEQGC